MHCWAWKKVKEIPKGKMNKENLETKIRVKGGGRKAEAESMCLQEYRALGTVGEPTVQATEPERPMYKTISKRITPSENE